MPISKITGQSIEDGSIVLADLGITTFNTGAGNTLTLQANSATGITIDVTGNTAIANTLSFTGTGARIRGDMSNATFANRVMFQDSTTNGQTSLGIIPNGTGVASSVITYNSSTPDNSSIGFLQVTNSAVNLSASRIGSGSFLPLLMLTGGSERLRIDTSGNMMLGVTTASSSTKFDVYGNSSAAHIGARVTNAATDGYSTLWLSSSNDGLVRGGSTAAAFTSELAMLTSGSIPLTFYTANTKRMTIGATGNIGIGTTSPSQLLHVAAGTILSSNTAGTIATVSIAGNGSTVGTSDFALQQGTSSEAYVYNRANSYLVLGTNNTERMRIDSSGNLLVGASSLNRLGSGSSGTAFQLAASGTPEIYISTASVSSGDFVGTVNFGTTGTSSATKRSALIGSLLTAASGTNVSGNLVFYTNNAGTLDERMRIAADGNVGIGTSSPQTKLYVSGGTIGNAGTNGIMYLMNGNTSGGVKIGAYTANGLANGYLAFEGYSIEYGRFDSSGNFGIGTSSPSGKLDVRGSSLLLINSTNPTIWASVDSALTTHSMYMQVNTTSSDTRIGAYTNHPLQFVTNNTERMRITAAGALSLGSSGSNTGSSGQVLVSQGSGSPPTWGSAAAAGQIIQVLQATNNTVYTISGGSGGANLTGMEITITPRNSSSRFLLVASLGQVSQSGGGATAVFNFTRNGTSLNYISGGTYNGVAGFVDNNSNLSPIMPCFSYIDSPGTASAITYRITISGDGTKYIGRRGNDDFFRASQQFQVLEIAG